jgi:uncharacterized protein (DUF4415 family)
MVDGNSDRKTSEDTLISTMDGAAGKRKVTLTLAPEILDKFRYDEPGWETRINEALRKALSDGASN